MSGKKGVHVHGSLYRQRLGSGALVKNIWVLTEVITSLARLSPRLLAKVEGRSILELGLREIKSTGFLSLGDRVQAR